MIPFEKYTLENGLRVILCEVPGSEVACVNLMYDVGARDEEPHRTGFAHLFEHLMFGGTPNVPMFDELVDMAGGQNNAFTSNDLTNYYINVPSTNLETALFLESDRMKGLSFTQESLDVQKQVVIEEFKQRYLNQPYGDIFLLLRPLAYKQHPYQWPTIGKEIAHIEQADLQEVKDFFYAHYAPNNAVLCITGGFDNEEAKTLIEKHFGSIPKRAVKARNLRPEPVQTEKRELDVVRPVPASAMYLAFPMVARSHADYPAYDILSDVLGYGDACRLHEALVEEQEIFGSISCFVGGDKDPGLFYIAGHLNEGVNMQDAEKAVWDVLETFLEKGFKEGELNRALQKYLTRFVASQVQSFHLAVNLCYYELLTQAEDFEKVLNDYKSLTEEKILAVAKELLQERKSNVLRSQKEA